MLGPSPILRIGGRSQELLRGVPPAYIFDSMAGLAKSANMRFVVGLPLETGDTGLAWRVMAEAKKYLGLGNEPDMWDRKAANGGNAR